MPARKNVEKCNCRSTNYKEGKQEEKRETQEEEYYCLTEKQNKTKNKNKETGKKTIYPGSLWITQDRKSSNTRVRKEKIHQLN